jgi:hypothetical protein
VIGWRCYVPPHRLEPGDYCRHEGVWYVCTPDGRRASLSGCPVTVHENGSISVMRPILVHGGDRDGEWHGWLVRGVWHDRAGQLARREGQQR